MNRRNFLNRLASLVPASVLASAATIFADAESGKSGSVKITFDDKFKRDHKNLPQSICLPSELCKSPTWRAAFLCAVAQRLEMTNIPNQARDVIVGEIEDAIRTGTGNFSIEDKYPDARNDGLTWKGRVLISNWGISKETAQEMFA